jgi:rhamnogalacturonan endolyase
MLSYRLLTPIACLLTLFATAASLRAAPSLPPVATPTTNSPVTVTDNGSSWTLTNGLVKATISKRNSVITSLLYRGVEIVGHPECWEQNPSGQITASLTIDPAKNGGERGEVAVKGINGRMDIEVRYTFERGVSGFYTYAQYSHEADYPAAGEGESRFILEMTPTFDWLSVDADRNMLMCSNNDLREGVVVHAKEQRILNTGIYQNSVEHKYSYCGVMYELPAYGWSSTKDHIGIYFINPSTEYIGGGAEKLDLVCHMGATILDYWTSGHYGGGAGCNVPAGEKWSKVVGPIYVYFNTLADPKEATKGELAELAATEGNPVVPRTWRENGTALFEDALAEAKVVKGQWPYGWVEGMDYPHKEERGTVTGQLVLRDAQAATGELPHLTVGLAHPDYRGNGSAFAQRSGNGNLVTWEHDGNHYEFWNEGSEDGKFVLKNVRAGTYTLHAFADGVLGEYAKTEIKVEAGKDVDLGKLVWEPVRFGKQLWEIGYPDRKADEFLKGDGANYWKWGWGLRYPLLFPHDVTYTVGSSDWSKDWFFEQVPHGESTAWLNPAAKDPANQPFGWVKGESLAEYPQTNQTGPWRIYGHGRADTWTIRFNEREAGRGQAVLRVALAGSDGTGGLEVGVNGTSVGTIRTIATNALRYNTDRGVWRQYVQGFAGGLIKAGENTMTLTVPAGDLTTGVVYDYLRLELNENAAAGAALPAIH